MRRYGVRFLVAILTFGIGVALSLVLGLFKPQQIMFTHAYSVRSCSKNYRFVRPTLVTVDSNSGAPLKLLYSGTAAGPYDGTPPRMQVSVQNTSGKFVSEYSISGEKIWQTSGKTSNHFLDWSFNDGLEPGESRFLTLPLGSEGISLSVVRVSFQDGSTWTNPRGTN